MTTTDRLNWSILCTQSFLNQLRSSWTFVWILDKTSTTRRWFAYEWTRNERKVSRFQHVFLFIFYSVSYRNKQAVYSRCVVTTMIFLFVRLYYDVSKLNNQFCMNTLCKRKHIPEWNAATTPGRRHGLDVDSIACSSVVIGRMDSIGQNEDSWKLNFWFNI